MLSGQGLPKLVALGLVEHERGRKYSVFTLSERWREIGDASEASRLANMLAPVAPHSCDDRARRARAS